MTTENKNCLIFDNKTSRCTNCRSGHSLDTISFKCAQNPPNTTIKDCRFQEVTSGFFKCQICNDGFIVDSKGVCVFDKIKSKCFSGYKLDVGRESCLACNYLENYFSIDTLVEGTETRQICRQIKSKNMVWFVLIAFLLMAVIGSYCTIAKRKQEKVENHKELKKAMVEEKQSSRSFDEVIL